MRRMKNIANMVNAKKIENKFSIGLLNYRRQLKEIN